LENILNLPNVIHFISKYSCGQIKSISNQSIILNKFQNRNDIVIYNHNNNTHKVNNLPNDDMLVVSYSTIVTGIHLAAYMGAKNIILIGHDCGTLDGEPNFEGYHDNNTYKIAHKNGKSDYILWLDKIENDTIILKKLLKDKYGCNIYSLNPFINFGLEGHIYNNSKHNNSKKILQRKKILRLLKKKNIKKHKNYNHKFIKKNK